MPIELPFNVRAGGQPLVIEMRMPDGTVRVMRLNLSVMGITHDPSKPDEQAFQAQFNVGVLLVPPDAPAPPSPPRGSRTAS